MRNAFCGLGDDVKVTAAIIVLLLALGFVGYTRAGARILNSFGLASACDSGCS